MKSTYEHVPEYTDYLGEGFTWAEKLDGIHAYWTGADFLTKTGNRISVPEFVIRPDEPCSGEIWLGRGRFEDLLTVWKNVSDARWHDVRFVPFHLMERHPITDVREHLQSVIRVGGEGIVIYAPAGGAWKLKERKDAEAVVVSRNKKHSYTVQCVETGAVFNLTALIEANVGEVVTYTYLSRYKSGCPREPIMKGIRKALSSSMARGA
jgi:hypothetical protein